MTPKHAQFNFDVYPKGDILKKYDSKVMVRVPVGM